MEEKLVTKNDLLNKLRAYKTTPDDASVIGKILIIQCVIFDEHQGYINSEKFQFEITE